MSETWTVLRLLKWTEEYFREKGIAEPRLDAQLLLADLLGVDRVGLYLNFDRPLDSEELSEFRSRVSRRGRREPVQYILGRTEFWSLPFRVSPAVLIPRADTEVLVESALEKLSSKAADILDVGTGSGAIAVVLAHEKPQAAVVAIDISEAALAMAADNASQNGVANRVEFRLGDLADLPAGPFDLIIANPPYIPAGELEELMAEVRNFEPHLALDGGSDGLAAMRRLAEQAPARLKTSGWLLVEVGIGQAAAVRELFLQAGLQELFIRNDYAGVPRVVGGRKSDPIRDK